MSASEKQRLALLSRLVEVLGREEAETLMESLPAVHWHDLATKDDIEASEGRLRSEMTAEFAKVYAELHSLRVETAAEFKELRVETAAEFKALRAETAAEFKALRAESKEFQGGVALQFARQTRTMVFTMLGLAVPILGAVLAVGLG